MLAKPMNLFSFYQVAPINIYFSLIYLGNHVMFLIKKKDRQVLKFKNQSTE